MRIHLKRTLFCILLALAPVVQAEDEAPAKSDAVKISQNTNGETVLTLDDATQKRIGLVLANPVAGDWQPQVRANGQIVNPLVLATAAADYESARAAATASQADLERTKILAAQENAAPRALETAQAAAARDAFALQSARAKFATDWGMHLAEQTNLAAYVEQLRNTNSALVKVFLPSGVTLNPLPASAQVDVFGQSNSINAEFMDDLGTDPATQMQTLLFSAEKKLPHGRAIVARVKLPGVPTPGVTIPASAILRHQNTGWVFVQTGATEFTRHEMPLDRATDNGFFTANLSATNRVVTTGAQTLLSAELSGGNFNSGQRD